MLRISVLLLVAVSGSLTRDCTYTAYEQENGALLLTPYIEEGRIKEGRDAALVRPLLAQTFSSYSGYFTVNKEYHSNMFFWYFPAEERSFADDKTPVILWLNGGPGASSLYGLLFENGPISLKDNRLVKRPIYWSKHYHVIYIDNPVGVGFSFTMMAGLVRNETQISDEMHTALVQFFQLFPELSDNDFFIAGESYAGRYVPSIAYKIHSSNPTSKVSINLKGVMIGNGILDPEVSIKRGMYLAEHGLLDQRLLPGWLRLEKDFVEALKAHDYDTAKDLYNKILVMNHIDDSHVNPYNYLEDGSGLEDLDIITSFFDKPFIRESIHVGKVKFCALSGTNKVNIWSGDGFMNVSPYVEILLEHYRVLYYNGQLDTTLPYPNSEEYTEKLRWSGDLEYHQAARKPWKVDGRLAGFSRSGGNLTLVLVRNAGHMVPLDQPEWALDLVTKFVNHQEVV